MHKAPPPVAIEMSAQKDAIEKDAWMREAENKTVDSSSVAENTIVAVTNKRGSPRSCLCVACIAVWASVVGVLLVGVLGFTIWAYTPLGNPPNAEVLAALRSTPDVTVTEHSGFYAFKPVAGDHKVGYIFYPGGHVDFRSYAPVLKEIARGGNFVALLQVWACVVR